MNGLAQVHCSLGHALADSVYSALRREYSIETYCFDLRKLGKVMKQCEICQLYAEQSS